MPSEKHQAKIQEIKNLYEKKGFTCQEETPIIRNGIINGQVGKIDLCCQHPKKIVRCFEVEDSQKQAVENSRDLQRMEKVAKQKGIKNYKGCQLLSEENPSEVCR